MLCLTLLLISIVPQVSADICGPDSCPPIKNCVQGDGFISCMCPSGKVGHNCTIDDPCLPRKDCPDGKVCLGTCEPNINCMAPIGIAYCSGCVVGYMGLDCQQDLDECSTPETCKNGGTCTNIPGSYECACAEGWVGKSCNCKKGSGCDVEELNTKDDDTKNGVTSTACSIVAMATALAFTTLF